MDTNLRIFFFHFIVENLGLSMVLLGKNQLFNLLQDGKTFKKLVSERGGRRILALISLLAEHCQVDNEKICSIILDTLSLYKGDEESLIRSLEACQKLLEPVKDDSVCKELIL